MLRTWLACRTALRTRQYATSPARKQILSLQRVLAPRESVVNPVMPCPLTPSSEYAPMQDYPPTTAPILTLAFESQDSTP